MAKNSNSPIKVGSIVRVTSKYIHGRTIYIGEVMRTDVWKPGGCTIKVPKHLSTIEISLERCYNAIEAERKEYFKDVLQYGK